MSNLLPTGLQREIKQLKQTVSSLQVEVESLRSVGNSPEITAPPSPGINQDRATYASVTNTGQSNPTSNPSRVTSNTTTTHHDKKFNLVVYGIEESVKVTLTLLFLETSTVLTLIGTPTLQGHHFLVTSVTLYIN